jgi:hypothetical protein
MIIIRPTTVEGTPTPVEASLVKVAAQDNTATIPNPLVQGSATTATSTGGTTTPA